MNDPKPQLPTYSILNAEVHARLIADMENVCAVAGTTPMFVHQRMAEHCSEAEIQWVTNYRQMRAAGKVFGYRLVHNKNVSNRCMAICGAFLRNFIDARVVTINQLIESQEQGQPIDPTVLIVPNLFMTTFGKSFTSWQIQTLYDLLLARMTAGRATVVYVQDMAAMAVAYGALIHEHVATHFQSEEQHEQSGVE